MTRCCVFAHHSARLVSRRFIHSTTFLAACIALFGFSYTGYAFVSLQAGSMPLYWVNTNVSFTVSDRGYDGIDDGSEITAVRQAFQTWEQVSSSRVTFNEDDSGFSRSRSDWQADDLHLVWFDHDNSSGFFSGTAGLVAITPVDFNPSTGEIIDADIIFNSKNYDFSTDLAGGTFDVQNVCTHEVGHLLGFDHSANVGATMNPFANTGDTRLRTLEKDDLAAAAAIYPVGSPPGAIQGFVRRNGNAVSGAHVVAEDMNGVAASAALSDGNGFFRIRGLDQGSYAIYAEPLDGPVSSVNFSLHTSNLSIDTDFGTTFYGQSNGRSSPADPDRVFVGFGQTVDVGTISTLSRAWMNITSISQLSVEPGSSQSFTVYGNALDRADAFVVPGPPGDGLTITNTNFGSGSAQVDLSVPSTAVPQLRTVRVFNQSTWECTCLTGGFEVRLPAPVITGFSRTDGAPGTTVTIEGENFQAGCQGMFGAEIVAMSGSGDRAHFTVPQVPNGTYSVSLENPDGQFARQNDVFVVGGSSGSSGNSGNSGSSGGSTGSSNNTPAPAPAPQAPAPSGGSVAQGAGGGGGGGGGGGSGCSLAPADERLPSPLSAAVLLLLLGGLGAVRLGARPAQA